MRKAKVMYHYEGVTLFDIEHQKRTLGGGGNQKYTGFLVSGFWLLAFGY